MNMFTYWVNEDGDKELVTAPLDDGTILPGVTRDSILQLAKGWGEFKVSGCKITMPLLSMLPTSRGIVVQDCHASPLHIYVSSHYSSR